jgi:hypothetical protein
MGRLLGRVSVAAQHTAAARVLWHNPDLGNDINYLKAGLET